MAINALKNNKTPGEDDLAEDHIKNCGEELINELTRDVGHKEEVPKRMAETIICPVYKKR